MKEIKTRAILFLLLLCCGLDIQARKTLKIGVSDVCRSSSSFSVGEAYLNAIVKGGHIPVAIPQYLDSLQMEDLVRKLDIIFLAGGEDVHPSYYKELPHPRLERVNEVRDTFEMRLLTEAVRQRKPIFGTCRGEQVINVFFGGSLYQDLPSQKPSDVNHRTKVKDAHKIHLEKKSRLYRILGTEEVMTNSIHHQAIKVLASGFYVSARAEDGVIEAIESAEYPVAAVQFHPEALIDDNAVFMKIYKQLNKLTNKK